jgi:hypothetical protein
LTRLEVLTEVEGHLPLEELAWAYARLLATGQEPSGQVCKLLWSILEEKGYVARGHLTEQGRAYVGSEPSGQVRSERRAFRFLATEKPHFVAISSAAPEAPPPDWKPSLRPLEEALARPAEWKARHRFPMEVRGVLAPPPAPGSEDWRHVPVAEYEMASMILVEVQSGAVTAYPVREADWSLALEPVWALPSARELEEVAGSLESWDWKGAWSSWCQQRSLPSQEVEKCLVANRGHDLSVTAPRRLLERLRQARSDAVKGEAWLAAGAGWLRPLARIVLTGDDSK